MARTVVYPSIAQAAAAKLNVVPVAPAEPDTFGDKLVKYIPAEVIAFFLPAFTLISQMEDKSQTKSAAGWLLLIVSALGLVGYLFVRADKARPPRWYFYVLSLLAFLAWTIGTSDVGTILFCLAEAKITGKLILMGAVFLIPLADELLTRLLPPK